MPSPMKKNNQNDVHYALKKTTDLMRHYHLSLCCHWTGLGRMIHVLRVNFFSPSIQVNLIQLEFYIPSAIQITLLSTSTYCLFKSNLCTPRRYVNVTAVRHADVFENRMSEISVSCFT